MKLRLSTDQVVASARAALAAGGAMTGPCSVELNVAGYCNEPVTVFRHGKPSPVESYRERHGNYHYRVKIVPKRQSGIYVTYIVPCRKCKRCLRNRRAMWTHRAIQEWKCWGRTWFGTLTFSAQSQSELGARARLAAGRIIIDGEARCIFDMEAADKRFGLLVAQANVEVTKYLKRIRKEAGECRLRYLSVVEAHKSGLPHFHILVHEQFGTVSKRTLQNQWVMGFSNYRLVQDENACRYIAKYLGKSADARVRASVEYGQDYLLKKIDKFSSIKEGFIRGEKYLKEDHPTTSLSQHPQKPEAERISVQDAEAIGANQCQYDDTEYVIKPRVQAFLEPPF